MSDWKWAETVAAASVVAERYNIPLRFLLAIAEIESRNNPGTLNRPLIRVEPHWFKKYVSPKQHAKARELLVNPASQDARWRNFKELAAIDAFGAYMSHSWGVMQVMGFNYEVVGCERPQQVADLAKSGPEGQYELGARFLVKKGLVGPLTSGDFVKFAERYNGPRWRENDYVNKLKRALAKFRDVEAPVELVTRPPAGKPTPRGVGIGAAIAALFGLLAGLAKWLGLW